MKPLGEFPDGLEHHFFLPILRLGDLTALVQHGPRELLGEGQRNEGAAEAEDAGVEQHGLVDGPADIDAEGRQHDVRQHLEDNVQCDGDEQVRNQQQPDPLQLFKHLNGSSFMCGVKGAARVPDNVTIAWPRVKTLRRDLLDRSGLKGYKSFKWLRGPPHRPSCVRSSNPFRAPFTSRWPSFRARSGFRWERPTCWPARPIPSRTPS